MIGKDRDVLKDKLDALSHRIEARTREFNERGAISGPHEAGMDDFRRRAASIKERLDAAISIGARWDIVKYELERDFNALNQLFSRFEDQLDRLDAETMKQTKSRST